jgi:voltage-gated potassium channel
MSSLSSFNHYFIGAFRKIYFIITCLLAVLVADAVAIAYFEKMDFGDALYFTFITGLTIGYGDIAPVTLMGRIIAILTGLQGMIITGLITAVAVYALRKAMESSTESKLI